MNLPSWVPIAAILLPLLATPVTAIMFRSRSTQAWVGFACLQLVLVLCLWTMAIVAGGGTAVAPIASARVLETRFQFVLAVDSLSAVVMVILVAVALANVAYYVAAPNPARARASQEPLLLLSLASTMAVVASGNLLTLYAFWQLSIVTFTLLAAAGPTERASAGAARYFVVNELAALSLLIALGLWYASGTPTDLSGWNTIGDQAVRGGVVGLLLLAGVLASGGFPFQTAFTASGGLADASVLSYLLSAGNKVGLYLLARVTLAQTDPLALPQAPYVLAALGAATVFGGGLLALAHAEPRRVLVDVSLLPVGGALIAAAAGGPLGVTAIGILVVAHALGVTAATLGLELERNAVATAGGALKSWLHRHQKLLGAAGYALGAATLAGIPPLSGFLGAALALHALAAFNGIAGGLAATFAILGSLMAAAALIRVGATVFLSSEAQSAEPTRGLESAFSRGTVAVLVALGVLGALLPTIWVGPALASISGVNLAGWWTELSPATGARTQPVLLWELALTVVVLIVPGLVFAANARRRGETAPVAREEAEHSRDYADLVDALSYTGRPAPDPATADVYHRWPRVASWLRAGEYDFLVLANAAVMQVAKLAAGSIRLTSRLFLR